MEDFMEQNAFTLAAMTAVLVSNDLHYVHLLAKGEDFDKSHNLAQDYYEKVDEEVDYLMELAIEVGAPIYNYSVAGEVVSDYATEEGDSYDYASTIEVIKNKVAVYITALKDLRQATEDSSIQSRLDDMLRDWEKELFYRLARRTEPTPVNSFINTGLDERVSNWAMPTEEEDYQ